MTELNIPDKCKACPVIIVRDYPRELRDVDTALEELTVLGIESTENPLQFFRSMPAITKAELTNKLSEQGYVDEPELPRIGEESVFMSGFFRSLAGSFEKWEARKISLQEEIDNRTRHCLNGVASLEVTALDDQAKPFVSEYKLCGVLGLRLDFVDVRGITETKVQVNVIPDKDLPALD